MMLCVGEFAFDGDAIRVRDFILKADLSGYPAPVQFYRYPHSVLWFETEWADWQSRRLKVVSHTPDVSGECLVKFGYESGEMYSIVIDLFLDGDIAPVSGRDVARIALVQGKPGECNGTLHIEQDPPRWYWGEPSDIGLPTPIEMGKQVILAFWTTVINAWNAQPGDEGDPLDEDEQRVKKALESDPLTERELEILALVNKGHSNEEIANSCTISKETVKSTLKQIFSKLEVRSRWKAARRACRFGLLK